jgi:hypothetical protein
MNITNRIRRSIRSRSELVFRPADFQPFGSEASVKRALKELTDIGLLVRLGVGLYAKAKPSVISGKPIPIQPLEVLGPQALIKLGVRLKESFQTAIGAGLLVISDTRASEAREVRLHGGWW